MEDSFLYDLLCMHMNKDYEQLRNEEDNNLIRIKNSRAELEKALTEEQLKLVDSYKYDCEFREEDINIQMSIKLLNHGVRIGMLLQKSFDKDIYE